MAHHQQRLYLVCYDIRDAKRLQAVHRYLVKTGIPVQYSVFVVDANAQIIPTLLQQIHRLIDRQVDDVRCYPLPLQPDLTYLGRQLFPKGVALINMRLQQAVR